MFFDPSERRSEVKISDRVVTLKLDMDTADKGGSKLHILSKVQPL